jgi:ABC-type multidrug transport system fused ATPase/permease subunit
MRSDSIIVLDHGEVIEFGSPNNLLDDPNSVFTGIVKLMKTSNK